MLMINKKNLLSLICLMLIVSVVHAHGLASAPSSLNLSGDVYDTTPRFSWSSIEGATYYRLAIKQGANWAVLPEPLPNINHYTLTSNQALSVGQCYTWTVRAEHAIGHYGPWATAKNICIRSLSQPINLSPSGHTFDTTPLFSWNSVAGANYYRLAIKQGSQWAVLPEPLPANNDYNLTHLQSLTSGQCYTWYVRAEIAIGNYGPWSLPQSLCIDEALADVVISDISWQPQNPEQGDVVTIKATIVNQGQVDTPDDTPVGVGVRIDGVYAGSFFVRNAQGQTIALTAGSQYTGTIDRSWTAVSGEHTVTAIADDIDRFDESDNSNNSRSEALYVSAGSQPDLIISSISLDPPHPQTGDDVKIKATISNQGQANVVGPIKIEISIDNVLLDLVEVNTRLNVGNSIQVVSSEWWHAIEGQHLIQAYVDPENEIVESNELNNNRELVVDVSAPSVDIFRQNVYDANDLNNAIALYKAGTYEYGEITIMQDMVLTETLSIREVDNLLIKGWSENRPLLKPSNGFIGTQTIAIEGRLDVKSNEITSGITLKNIKVQIPMGPSKIGISVVGSKTPVEKKEKIDTILMADVNNVLIKHVDVLPPINDVPYPTHALWIGNTEKVVITHVSIDRHHFPDHGLKYHYGTGMRIFNSQNFAVTNNTFAHIKHGFEAAVPCPNDDITRVDCYRRDSYALLILNQVDQADFQGAMNGLIGHNHFSNTSGQTIFFIDQDGRYVLSDFVLANNNMNNVAIEADDCALIRNGPTANLVAKDCGGRGIYPSDGKNYLIKDNMMNNVGYAGASGGINAGLMTVKDVIIDGNLIDNVGNSVGGSCNMLNGYGIQVRENAWVKNNIITKSSNNGIIISEGSHNVLTQGNTIDQAGLNGIRVNAGYYVERPPMFADLPYGPSKNITIRNETITNNMDDGILITVNRDQIIDERWYDFDVVLQNNNINIVPPVNPMNCNSPIIGRWINFDQQYKIEVNGPNLMGIMPALYLASFADRKGCQNISTDISISDDVNWTCSGMPRPAPDLTELENHLLNLQFPSTDETGAIRPMQ